MDVQLPGVVVVKLGGSVLVDDDSYRQAAKFLVDRSRSSVEERFIVVVSARKGATDELERLANGSLDIRIREASTFYGARRSCVR